VTLYAWLLRLYPAEFRDAFGAEMRSLFAARHAEARAQGRAAVARAWIGVILDTLRTAAAEHVDIARRDARQAWRGLVRDRTYLVFGAGVLALGFAATVTILGVVQAVLLAPLPYPDPERLVRIEQLDPRGGTWGFAEPTFLDFAERSTTLQDVAALRVVRGTLSGDGTAETIDGARVSVSWFALLGVRPSFGRVFSAAADRPGGPCEVLATDGLADRRF